MGKLYLSVATTGEAIPSRTSSRVAHPIRANLNKCNTTLFQIPERLTTFKKHLVNIVRFQRIPAKCVLYGDSCRH